MHIMEADSIQAELNGRKLLSDIYIKSETGKITGLLGRNGEGKTYLLNIIYGVLTCEKSVRFDNISQNMAFTKPALIRYLPQFNFVPKNLSLKKIFNYYEIDFSNFENEFREFRIKYNATVGVLSGGEIRLVELYIILKSKSQFILLDEPFTHLMPIQTEKIKQLLLEEKMHKGIILTDHLYNDILDICNDIYVLAKGKTHLVKSLKEIETMGYLKQG